MGHEFVFFFFKQKTAYEMRISDWSSDVCSSDLAPTLFSVNSMTENLIVFAHGKESGPWGIKIKHLAKTAEQRGFDVISPDYRHTQEQIGRASCRERVCQYV